MNVREPLLAFAPKQSNSESVSGGFAQPKLLDVGNVHESFGVFRVRPDVNSHAIAQQFRRAYCSSGQQQLVCASTCVRPALVVFVSFPEHEAAGALEKLRAAVRKRATFLSGLAQHSQRQRVSVDILESPVRQVIQDTIRIDLAELTQQKLKGIIISKRLQMEQQRVFAIVFLDLDAIRGPQPVRLTAGKDEGRAAHSRS